MNHWLLKTVAADGGAGTTGGVPIAPTDGGAGAAGGIHIASADGGAGAVT